MVLIGFGIILSAALAALTVVMTVMYRVLRRAVRDGLLEASGLGD